MEIIIKSLSGGKLILELIGAQYQNEYRKYL
jgi:hypothetical protein